VQPDEVRLPRVKAERDPVPAAPEFLEDLLGGDRIEFLMGNAGQVAHLHRAAFGFDAVAFSGPEAGVRDRAPYLLRLGT
jgi:4-hydroxyphenylpyruvate dioxygenase